MASKAKVDALPALSRLERLTSLDEVAQYMAEAAAREREVEKSLDAMLAQQGTQLARMSALKRAQPRVAQAQRDARKLAGRIGNTCLLAQSVARRVRELDRAKTRLALVRDRVAEILALRSCVDGVQAAMASGDLEAAARHIERYASFSPDVLEEVATDQLELAQGQLKEAVRSRFDAAAESGDTEQSMVYARLLSQIGLKDEGLTRYARALARKLAREASALDADLEATLRGEPGGGLTFVDALTGVYDAVAATLEGERGTLDAVFGAGAVATVLAALENEAATAGAKIVRRLRTVRALDQHARRIGQASFSAGTSAADGAALPSLVELDLMLYELASLSNRSETYLSFLDGLRSAGSGPVSVHTRPQHALAKELDELTAAYLVLEVYYLAESVAKAMALDAAEGAGGGAGAGGGGTGGGSALLDDVFYVLQKVTRRAVSSLNINALCAVINNVDGALNTSLLRLLKEQIARHGVAFAKALNANRVGAREPFATVLNHLDTGAVYIGKLRAAVEAELGSAALAADAKEKAGICVASLGDTADAFRATLSEALDSITSAMQPRIKPHTESLSQVSYELSEAAYAQAEAVDPFVRGFTAGIGAAIAPFQSLLSPANFDAYLQRVIGYVAGRLEAELRQKRFNQLGALQFDKELRAIVSYFAGLTQKSVREKLAKLTQMATLLNMESVDEVRQYWGAVSWRLSAADVKRTLRLRIEFSADAIDRLALQ